MSECFPRIVPETPSCETLAVPVLRVFDGDGFLTVIPQRGVGMVEVGVRFGFIDAPEMDQPGGPEARDFLLRLIGRRWLELVILTKSDTGGIVDRYGRIVCIPYLPGSEATGWMPSFVNGCDAQCGTHASARNIELEMVLNGWAWVLERYCPDERYMAALEEARWHRRGIWANDNNVQPWAFKSRQRAKSKARSAPSSQSDLFAAQTREACPRPSCTGHIIERSGRFGSFCGCTSFPSCRYTRPVNHTASLVGQSASTQRQSRPA